jgi:flavin reductase (DIM6/NTAB) family NADH-FMN oxidoreductase RutF
VIDQADFRRALGQFASGVTVVTTRDSAGRPYGLTVSSFCSVSLEPPLVLVCIDHRSEAHDGFEASQLFGVSVLAEGQEEWSRRFAEGGPAKFAGATLGGGHHGVALVPGALAHLECRVVSAHEAGDHTIYVGEVLALSVQPGRPLLYHARGYCRVTNGAGPAKEPGGSEPDQV